MQLEQLENVLLQSCPCPRVFVCPLSIGAFATMFWHSWLDSMQDSDGRCNSTDINKTHVTMRDKKRDVLHEQINDDDDDGVTTYNVHVAKVAFTFSCAVYGISCIAGQF